MNHSLLLIKGKNEPFTALATDAMERAFPGSKAKHIDSVEEAASTPKSGGAEIVVLLDPNGEEASRLEGILDERKLPRWAVIRCEGFQSIGNWTQGIAPYLLYEAWSAHLLKRENATLRGNIRALGVRVAHDMRTPLGSILSAAETLKEEIAVSNPANLTWVDNIIESEADLLRLVRHQTMLADELARPIELSDFDMGDAVRSALEWLEGKLTLSKAVLSKPAEWPSVRGDRRKYERIWKVLVENSIRHGGGGLRIELGWEASGPDHKFWVSNDGSPVPTEKQATLFRPFHRLHEPDSGRGLSLSMMEELVNSQGGVCGYETGPVGNPTFYFTVVR